jgi:hypothetical protein
MIGSLMMCVGSFLLLIGMLAGIVMGIQQDFTLAPAHAHLNLVGGVLLFMFGLYYRLVPAAGSTSLAKLQGWLHIAGAILFPAGIALVVLKGTSFIAAPIIGSLIVVAAMALFALIVFRSAQSLISSHQFSSEAKAVLAVAVLPGAASPARVLARSR